MSKPQHACWCGNSRLVEFDRNYLRCPVCETLVIRSTVLDDSHPAVGTAAQSFYGRAYAEQFLSKEYGYPSFESRSRTDLPERCLHWLGTLLKYRQPPASLLELGCFHGGFVALAKLAGFEARGLDMSVELAGRASKMFDVEILIGPLEQQKLPAGSLDVIALFDVIEHLPDPRSTLTLCAKLLKPDGLLILQTPRYDEATTLDQMLAAQDTFLQQLKPKEHLFLFSHKSIEQLLRAVGFAHVIQEPAIFAHYDMFAVASRLPLSAVPLDSIAPRLAESAQGRFALAFLDLWKSNQEGVGPAPEALKNERNLLQFQLADLRRNFDGMERDRAERGRVIEQLGAKLSKLEGEFDTLLKELQSLYASAEALKNERNLLQAQLADLHANFAAVEKDRADRGQLIEQQGKTLTQLEAEFDARLRELKSLYISAESLKNERNLVQAQLADLQVNFAAVEKDRADRARVIDRLESHRIRIEEKLRAHGLQL